jgi:putative acetyltransferase
VSLPPTIRAEAPDDVDQIAAVVESAFGSPVESRLVAAIRASDRFVPALSLVADVGGEIVGHVMVSLVDLAAKDRTRLVHSLSPLAVAPAWQHQGIGSALVREVIARCRSERVGMIVLEGNPAYYRRFGFEYSVPLGVDITLPGWAPAQAAQLLRLEAYDPSVRGEVRYPPAFDESTADR